MDLRRGSGEPSCFVHVGTHKTGTTAIQRFLAGNRERLALDGLYYPRTGWLSGALPGHHNVASELAGDRFDRAAGTLGDVVAEIARARPRNACLSSENFEYLHVRDDALAALRDAIVAIGYRPRIVVYVRAQDEYAESLYAELVKHGMLLPFASFLDAVTGAGVVWYDRAWAFRFEYTKLASRFAAVFGSDAVIVRAYRDDGAAGSIVPDFLDAIGVAPPAAAAAEPPVYENMRLTTGGVIEQLFRNTAAHLHDAGLAAAGAELVARDPHAASEPFRPLTPRDRERVGARFAGDNARLAQRWPAARIAERRRAVRLEPERARGARRLFEHAEAVRFAYVRDARLALETASSG
jgi:hypothetical protein